MLEFTCPSCVAKVKVDDKFAGRRAKCPKCAAALTIPMVSGEPARLAPAEPLAAASSSPSTFTPTATATPPEKKPTRWGVIVAVVVGLGVASNMISRYMREEREQKQQQLASTVEEMQRRSRENMERAARGEDVSQDQQKLVSEMTARMRAAGTGSTEEDKAMRISASVLGELNGVASAFNSALQRLTEAGGLSAAGLESPEAIAKRIDLTKEVIDANAKLAAAFEALPDRMSAEAKKEGVSSGFVEGMLSAYQAKSPVALVRRVREADKKMLGAMLADLELLQKQYGRWKLEGNKMQFDDPASGTLHNQLIARVNESAQEETAAQQALIAKMRQ